jgi:hypothetical protein
VDYAQKTFDDLRKFVFALPARSYTVRCVPATGSGPTIPVTYTLRQLLASYRYLRRMNAGDHHVFGRPDSTRFVLIDDLDRDALDRLDADLVGPSMIIETSKANHQAWIAVSGHEIPDEIATVAANLLARRYGGDLGSAHAQHVGRLPGLRNRKEQYCTAGHYPLCRLVRATDMPKVGSGATCLLDEAAAIAIASPAFPPSTRGACAPTSADAPASDMTPDECREIYAEAVSDRHALVPCRRKIEAQLTTLSRRGARVERLARRTSSPSWFMAVPRRQNEAMTTRCVRLCRPSLN